MVLEKNNLWSFHILHLAPEAAEKHVLVIKSQINKHIEYITWRFWLARATAGSNSARLGPTVAWNFGGSMSAKTESSFEDDSVETTLSGPAALTSSGSWGAESIFDVAGKLNGWNTFSAITGESTDPEDLEAFVRLSDLWNKSKGFFF